MRFSVVIPIFNEEGNIPELYGRLRDVLEDLCRQEGVSPNSFEVLFVNDGSSDRSWELIEELHASDPCAKGISFSRNFGHHVALTAGIDHAAGDVVVLMDGDLQDPPEEIPKLYAKFKEGYDLVYGIRIKRKDPLMKKLTSRLFWWLLRSLSGIDMPQGQTMLRIMSRRMTDALRGLNEYARFVHGLMAWVGYRTTTVEVAHNQRTRGESKYSIRKMFMLAFHGITSFSTFPLKLATYVGLFCSLISIMFGLYYIGRKLFFDIPVLGYASIIVAVFFMGGIQLLILGVFGEYLGRIYQESQKRPLYLIDKQL